MTPHLFQSLVAALIRIGLLLALAIMLMAENAQAQSLAPMQPAGGATVHAVNTRGATAAH